jgi:hypothetical protein
VRTSAAEQAGDGVGVGDGDGVGVGDGDGVGVGGWVSAGVGADAGDAVSPEQPTRDTQTAAAAMSDSARLKDIRA